MPDNGLFLQENRQRIEKEYNRLAKELPQVFDEINARLSGIDKAPALAIKYLYANMPYSDIGNYPFDTYLDYAAHGVFLWKTYTYVRELPEALFLNYVLHHRVNEEEITPCRSFFYEKLNGHLKGKEGEEAAIEVNYWCAGEVTYQSGDDRTLSPMAVYLRGNGRCGEESAFCVNAMRSVGIPARQVYAPKWSHCDDNHAWVEIWCNGTWAYTGACEPEPVLNRGWFTNAASRAMMVHSRWFDSMNPGGGIIGREGMVTMLNELSRYAGVKKIAVKVTDRNGKPAEGAAVSFEVLNYAEYAPIGVISADKEGMAELETGLGSLHIFAAKDNVWGEGFIDTRREAVLSVRLDERPLGQGWQEWDMTAPGDKPVNRAVPSKEQAELGKARLSLAVEKRIAKTADWRHPDREAFLSRDLNTKKQRLALLSVLSDKDRTDFCMEVLEEHLKYGMAYEGLYEPEIFALYILNPRVEDEVLSCFREIILNTFTNEQKEQFCKNPVKIWEYIEANISSCENRERDSLITTPAACIRLGIGSKRSKKILFTAIARTLGIPARLNPNDRSMEYMENGIFVPLLSQGKKNCCLLLRGEDGTIWNYFRNWTIGRMEDGNYTSLRLADKVWEKGELKLQLKAGRYRILTANRLPNGNIFANQYEFLLTPGEEKELNLLLRKADLADMLENISIPEFSLLDSHKKEIKGSDLTEGGRHILLFLEESKEPTEHILNEMMEQKQEFRRYAPKIIFVVKSEESLKDPAISKVLGALPGIRICYDNFTDNINMLGRRMYVDHEKLPLIIVTDGRLNGIYAASGYNVGTGDMLLRLM